MGTDNSLEIGITVNCILVHEQIDEVWISLLFEDSEYLLFPIGGTLNSSIAYLFRFLKVCLFVYLNLGMEYTISC